MKNEQWNDQIDAELRKQMQCEEITIPDSIEDRWTSTLRNLPASVTSTASAVSAKKEKRNSMKWLGAVAAGCLLSVSIYAIYTKDSIEFPQANQDAKATDLATADFSKERRAEINTQSASVQPYNLTEIKQGFPYEIYGFEAVQLNEQAIAPTGYTLIGEEIMEITYRVGEAGNGFVLRQTVVDETMRENITASFTTMVDYKGTPLYRPVELGASTFYLFTANPELEAVSVGEMVIGSQWIQIQGMDYVLNEAAFTQLFQALEVQ